MNFAAMLMREVGSVEQRSSNDNTKRRTSETYRRLLHNQEKTISELAECLDYTYEGTYATVKRMIKRGLINVVGHKPSTGGRKKEIITWA